MIIRVALEFVARALPGRKVRANHAHLCVVHLCIHRHRSLVPEIVHNPTANGGQRDVPHRRLEVMSHPRREVHPDELLPREPHVRRARCLPSSRVLPFAVVERSADEPLPHERRLLVLDREDGARGERNNLLEADEDDVGGGQAVLYAQPLSKVEPVRWWPPVDVPSSRNHSQPLRLRVLLHRHLQKLLPHSLVLDSRSPLRSQRMGPWRHSDGDGIWGGDGGARRRRGGEGAAEEATHTLRCGRCHLRHRVLELLCGAAQLGCDALRHVCRGTRC
mmetsp:Transcript_13611/g.44793  ORF Transcript_13611/g.44793 Transcript_13611/m.44793 type:complete len:276 (+) Transcript_13611:1784-2611(+)